MVELMGSIVLEFAVAAIQDKLTKLEENFRLWHVVRGISRKDRDELKRKTVEVQSVVGLR